MPIPSNDYINPLHFVHHSEITHYLYGQHAFEQCKGRLFISDGKPLSGSNLRLAFTSVMHKMLGYPLSFNDYRHCAVTFGRWHIVLDKGKSMTDSFFDFQAGHSTITAAQEYGRSNIDHSVLDAIAVDRFYQWSSKWQSLICEYIVLAVNPDVLCMHTDNVYNVDPKSSDHPTNQAPSEASEAQVSANRELLEEVALLETRARVRQRELVVDAMQKKHNITMQGNCLHTQYTYHYIHTLYVLNMLLNVHSMSFR